ncbi:MAG: TonB-dependent receptor [candidate division WOR-3 bacterium]
MTRLILPLCLLAFGLQPASGSGPTGAITGRVFDGSTRSPLPGASIIVVGSGLGAAAGTDGRFVIAEVPAGLWTVEASMVGYRTQVRTDVVVTPGHSSEISFPLAVEAISVTGVTVRADYFPRVKDAPVSERNFSAKEVELAPGGSGDIQRVVQAMPSVVSSGDQDNEVIVRGGNPNENLFLIDGIELPYPNHFPSVFAQGGPINLLNPLLVREVDFIAGAFPARFGNRASSVMDISLKRGPLSGFDGNIDLGMAGLGVVAGFPLPGSGNSFIGSYHKSFLELMAKAGVWGMSAVPYYDNFLGKATFRLSPANELFCLGLWGKDFIYIRPGENVSSGNYSIRQTTTRWAGGIGLQTLFGEQGFGRLLLSGSSTGWDALVYDDTTETDTMQSSLTSESFVAGRYDATWRWLPGQETQAGVGLTWIPFDYDLYVRPETVFRYVYDNNNNVVDSFPLLDPQGNPYVIKLHLNQQATASRLETFLQHRTAIGSIGHLTFGARLDRFSYTGRTDFSPRLGFSSAPLLAGVSFNAGWGWHHQTPPWHVLVADTVANHNLRSRRADHYVFGVERRFGDDVRLTLEAFQKNTSFLPVGAHWFTADPYDFSPVYYDSGRGTSRGLELFLQKKYSRNWNGSLAYSLCDAREETPGESGLTRPSDYDYRHILTATGTYAIEFHRQQWYQRLPGWFKATIGGIIFSDEALLGARWRYMTGRPYTPREWNPETRRWLGSTDLYNSARYPDYNRLDLRWDHKFIFKRWSLSWYVEAQNLLDSRNVWMYVYHDGNPERETVLQMARWIIGGMVIEF